MSNPQTSIRAAAFVSILAAASIAIDATAQVTAPHDSASMVKPPPAASGPTTGAGTTRPDNPDNMPVKRPTPPPGSDRMLHNSPESDAIAK
jgi:hypothetical protein